MCDEEGRRWLGLKGWNVRTETRMMLGAGIKPFLWRERERKSKKAAPNRFKAQLRTFKAPRTGNVPQLQTHNSLAVKVDHCVFDELIRCEGLDWKLFLADK